MIAFRRSLLAPLRTVSASPVRSSVRFYSKDESSRDPANLAGQPGGDSFSKRERAQEEYYVREHEKEQLKKLRHEIEAREKDLAELKSKADKLEN